MAVPDSSSSYAKNVRFEFGELDVWREAIKERAG